MKQRMKKLSVVLMLFNIFLVGSITARNGNNDEYQGSPIDFNEDVVNIETEGDEFQFLENQQQVVDVVHPEEENRNEDSSYKLPFVLGLDDIGNNKEILRIQRDIDAIYSTEDEDLLRDETLDHVSEDDFYKVATDSLSDDPQDETSERFSDDDEDAIHRRLEVDREQVVTSPFLSLDQMIEIYSKRAQQCEACQDAMTELRYYFNNQYNRLRMEMSFVMNCKYIFHRHHHDKFHYMHLHHKTPHLSSPPEKHFKARGYYNGHKHLHFHHGGNYLIRLCQRIMTINARKMFKVTAKMLRHGATHACYVMDKSCIHRYNMGITQGLIDTNNTLSVLASQQFNNSNIWNRNKIYGKEIFDEDHPVCKNCERRIQGMKEKQYTHYDLYQIFKQDLCRQTIVRQHSEMCLLQLRLNYPFTLHHLHKHRHVTPYVICSMLNLCPAIFDDTYDDHPSSKHKPVLQRPDIELPDIGKPDLSV